MASDGSGGGDTLAITLGVEEEFFLVDPETRDILAEPDPRIFEECERTRGPHEIVPELLCAQIETNTRVCGSLAELRAALRETRGLVVAAAEKYGAAVLAASTHPFASWRTQMITPRDRYRRATIALQETVRRFLVGGMHVHAGFGDPDSRIRVMTAARRHLPLLLALSASSPFDTGRETGFKSYRPNIIGTLPRSGIPGPLRSRAEYDRLVEDYRRMGSIEDGSFIWWDIRPSHAFPTVEMRSCDVCPRLEDAVSIAALYACLVRHLLRRDREGTLPPEPPTEIVVENRWLAQRYGVLAFFGDHEEGGGPVDIEDYAARLVAALAEDAQALGCVDEIARVRAIIREGGAADRQVDEFRLRQLDGASEEEALRAVVDLVLAETRAGVAPPA